jgi:hypothetical protein
MKPPLRDYEVGYRRPPAERSFRKGASGNPGGRPRGSGLARAKTLVLKEIYRLVTVREGDKVFRMPALQAVLRQQIALAIKGKGPAGQAMLQLVNQIERELAALTAAEATMVQEHSMSELDIARRIALALELGRQQLERHVQEGSAETTDERCS